MSYISIVGGKITKTTGGAHHMYSEESIVFNSGKCITETGEENGIIYGEPKKAPVISQFKKISNIKWMCADMKNQISSASIGSKVSLLVKTSHYAKGETISLKIKEIDDKDIKRGVKELTFTGTVNEDGFAELKEQVEIEN
jgi:hypothetical protein